MRFQPEDELGVLVQSFEAMRVNLKESYAELEQRVTERTAELAEAKEHMEAILASVGDQVVVTDLKGVIVTVNAAWQQQAGYTAQEVIGQNPRILKSGRTPPEVYQAMWSTISRGEVWSGELVNRRKDGSLYDTQLTIAPVRNQAGQIVGYVGSERDITRQKDLDRLKSQFVADVSHELRTPVTNLKLYLDLLETGNPEKRARYLATLKEQADQLTHLVEDILDLSRLERNQEQVEFTAVDLNLLVEQAVDAHHPAAERAGLSLNFAPASDLPPVRGEARRLQQVITNLVANAINYTAIGQVQVSVWLADDQVCLQVQDTGMGIGAEDLPHVFERFYRGQGIRQSSIPGTGLGLGIVKEIVEMHGGKVAVESQVDVGSTFRVWLPASSAG